MNTPRPAQPAGARPPRWYWAVSALAFLWNLLGVVAFAGQLTMDPDTLPAAQRAFHESTPSWATAGFAAAVSGGALGSAALLLRKSWAAPLLVVSLLGITVQSVHSVVVSNGIEVFGPAGLVLPIATFGIAAALIWFARLSANRGWIA